MKILYQRQRSALNSRARSDVSQIACWICCLLILILAWGCGGEPEVPPCCGLNGEWVPTETWPGQRVARVDVAEQQIAKYQRDGMSVDAVRTSQIDGLRGAVVTHIPAEAIAGELRPTDSWRPRLLASSAGFTNDPAASIGLLRAQLAQAQQSEDPAALIWEAAIRADLAFAMVALARDEQLSGEAWKSALEKALAEVDDWCQVPEVLLNAAAIQLELAELAPTNNERLLLVSAAETALGMFSSDANVCSERRGAFLGSVGSGSPIAFILDASGSMELDDKYSDMIGNLRRTIEQMPSDSLFSIFLFNANGFELLADPRHSDQKGRFRRVSLGELGKHGDLDVLFKRLESVIDFLRDADLEKAGINLQRLPAQGANQVGSCPSDALARALELGPKTIFLATDGQIYERSDGQFKQLAEQARDSEIVINTFLFYEPTEGGGSGLKKAEADAVRLRRMCELTGGNVTFVARGATGASTLDRTGLHRPSSLSESLYQRALRRGYWTPEAERQFSVLAANVFVHSGEWPLASQAFADALLADGNDVVLGAMPDAATVESWPRTANGEPVPADGALLYGLAMTLALAGQSEEATRRFDDAAVVWASCSTAASKAGLSARAAADADLACRALLFGCLSTRDRAPESAGHAYARAKELGVVKSAGWNQKLLAAGAGDVAYWRARAAVWMHDDGNTPVMQVELELVRSFFEPQAQPATIDFSLFPYIEAEFMRKVQKQIAEGSQP